MTAVKSGGIVKGSAGGGAAGAAGQILSSPEVQQQILSTLLGLLSGLFKREPKALPAVKPGGTPRPSPNQTDVDFPDDVIGAPPSAAKRTVKTVVARFIRAQYSRQRNPEMYGQPTTENPDANPQGLYNNPRQYEGGKDAVNIGAKGWVDATAYDENGDEFLRDAVIAAGLSFKTEHHVGDAFIKGKGGTDRDPLVPAPYETNDTEQVGNGITAWRGRDGEGGGSLGFLHQVKFHAEGTHDVYVVVGGVESNHFKLRVD